MADGDVKDEDFKEAGGGGGKNPLLTIILLVNTVLMGVVAYMQFDAHNKKAKEPSVRDIIKAEMDAAESEKEDKDPDTGEAKEKEGIPYKLNSFTANLAQGDGPRRYIRLTLVLKFSVDSEKKEYEARRSQIRDTIIGLLNSKRPEDLLRIEGKAYLKEEIKASINSFLIDGHVIDVFYTNFQIN
ncbi:MAG: flagellar basal body-associated FliL family protein [Halobacteriovoraceae bacterium]|nr:flagellar basal body-associated FliL family protein [Halobacteriovoraceae bacterium]